MGPGAPIEVSTGQGPALLDWTAPAAGPVTFVMALTHGAGGTTGAADLHAARDAAVQLGGGVALVTQPYRVRGARAPGSAERQDQAWIEIMTALTSGHVAGRPAPPVPLVVGGRSNGARVACRTAAAVGARGVLALAFPLQPPARRNRGRATAPFPSDRSAELQAGAAGGAQVLVLNGDRDPFGIPSGDESISVVVLKGETHALSKRPVAVTEAVAAWLSTVMLVGAGGNGVG
ncbi:MAG TPA: alpha/beta family hydrolase [Streptosporangiaceae bacterium]